MLTVLRNLSVGVTTLAFFGTSAFAECNPKDFIVQDTLSIQQSGYTELAFVLTATQSEYENAKKNFAGSGSYGLFSAALNYGQAKERAFQIAQSTKFDFKSSYASNYLSQSVSGRALDALSQCWEKDKERPGIALWLKSRDGDFFTFNAFWVGADTTVPAAKFEGEPIVDGGRLLSKPDAWIKGKTEEIVIKRDGNNDLFLQLKVGGQTKSRVVVKDPPLVEWRKEQVVSKKILLAQTTTQNPGCAMGFDTDTIYPTRPGGYFVAGTRTTNVTTNGRNVFTETFEETPHAIKVTFDQRTGACEHQRTARGQLQAIETFPLAVE